MQLFISILPLSFVIVTQNCMIGYHVLGKYTCIEYFLYESIYLTQFGDGMICVLVISLLEFASYLFCTLLLVTKLLVLVLKRKLSYHRCRSIRAAPLCILRRSPTVQTQKAIGIRWFASCTAKGLVKALCLVLVISDNA
jgi:hypothetical protein